MINQKYKLNLIPGGIPIRIPISQFDLNSRTIEFELFKGNTKFEAPGDTKCTVQGLKSDGTGFVYDASINKNIAKFELKEQMTVVPGIVECELKLMYGNEVLATARFDLVVKRSPISNESVISKSEIPVLVKLAKEQEENAKKYAEQAKQNSDTATNAVSRIDALESNAKKYADQAKASEAEANKARDTSKANANITKEKLNEVNKTKALIDEQAKKVAKDVKTSSSTIDTITKLKDTAVASSDSATKSKDLAKQYADQAKQSETNSKKSETNAKASETSASKSAKDAQTSATEALHQANNASDHASKALEFKDQAKQSEAKANEFMEEARQARDDAAGYAGASTYSFMIDSEGYICLNHKEEK